MSTYTKAVNGRGKPIRGLWQRGRSFYAQITRHGKVSRVKLKSELASSARYEMDLMRENIKDHPAPTFNTFADEYLAKHTTGKAATTIKCETSVINRLRQAFGEKHLDEINADDIGQFRSDRLKETSGRTVNLNISILSAMMKVARTLGYVQELPTAGVKAVRYQAKRKALLSAEDIEAVCVAAVLHCENGQIFSDYVKFLAYTGCRASEALAARWGDFDPVAKRFTFIRTKNGEVRDVDLNTIAISHLTSMSQDAGSPKASELIFPTTYQQLTKTLILATEKANRPQFKGFHILRHYFISRAVMSGVDYLTVAAWSGHRDGGILIGKTYGHLNNEHKIAQAAKLKF